MILLYKNNLLFSIHTKIYYCFKGIKVMEKNYTANNSYDMPLGLGMALAKNINAMNRFASLSQEEQRKIINQTHQIQSKQEMTQFAENIEKGLY